MAFFVHLCARSRCLQSLHALDLNVTAVRWPRPPASSSSSPTLITSRYLSPSSRLSRAHDSLSCRFSRSGSWRKHPLSKFPSGLAQLRFMSMFGDSRQPSVTPHVAPPEVAVYLGVVASLVFAIVVVGGLTRLTESGLSITEWNLVSGTLPPLSEKSWQQEFEKYQTTPEWRMNNRYMELDDFKYIYKWEWGHRFLGRVIGLTFLLPIPIFLRRKALTPSLKRSLVFVALLIGGQGALGWYMVKSGIDQIELDRRDGIPRVSQYRLAAHLGMAFAVYAACVRLSVGIWRDWRIATGHPIGGVKGQDGLLRSLQLLENPMSRRVRFAMTFLTGLVLMTAASGAFVAGLDAGLLFNTFPFMGEHLIPPSSDLFSPSFARDKMNFNDLYWRNMLENPTTVQLNHRILATTTFLSISLLTFLVRRPPVRALLPPATMLWMSRAFYMSLVQVGLGISTLLYLVPTSLAALHQAGSLSLLTLTLAAGLSLRRPSLAARACTLIKTK